jgi:mannose-6-phosphate isomerase class I
VKKICLFFVLKKYLNEDWNLDWMFQSPSHWKYMIPLPSPASRSGTDAEEWVYPAPVEEFSLSRIVVRPGGSYSRPADGKLSILIVMEGSGTLGADRGLCRGLSAYIPADEGLELAAPATAGQDLVVFRATTNEGGQ